MSELLRAEDIDKHYDGVHALKNVHFEVTEGEVHALVGENGAGKSTLGKILSGVVKADKGNIFIMGEKVAIQHPLEAQRLGISIIFQELDLFPHLSVAENIAIGNLKIERRRWVNLKQLDQYCRAFIEQVGLHCSSAILVKDLSIAQMQQLAIARSLSMNTRLIIMDEPTSSLPETAVETLFDMIRKLKTTGVSIIFISHKLDEIFNISDRITVLRDGEYIATRETAATNVNEIIKMMVGRELKQGSFIKRQPSQKVCLYVKNLTTSKLKNISFELHRGEVLGIAGLVGAGRSELGTALFGLDRIIEGLIEIDGSPFRPETPGHAIRQGFALVPEDRKLQGLMMQLSIKDNSSIAILDQLNLAGFIRHKEEARTVKNIHERLAVKSASLSVPVNTLSGGNQQKVLLSKCLLIDPEVIFLDDPTRGVDVGAKKEIYGIIRELADSGKGVIFVSSELSELLLCCDRIMVLYEGENMGILNTPETNQEEIMAMATRSVPATGNGQL